MRKLLMVLGIGFGVALAMVLGGWMALSLPVPSHAAGGSPLARGAAPAGPTATPTAICAVQFADVPVGSPDYAAAACVSCYGILSSYVCGGVGEPCNPSNDPYFRPTATPGWPREQVSKLMVLGAQLPIVTPPAGDYTFADVLPSYPFFSYIETMAANSLISGYVCGGPGEPCDSQHRPYFRPTILFSRGQFVKVLVVTAGWQLENPPAGHFSDVPPASAFYTFVETAYSHNAMLGYADQTFHPSDTFYDLRIDLAGILSRTWHPECGVAPRLETPAYPPASPTATATPGGLSTPSPTVTATPTPPPVAGPVIAAPGNQEAPVVDNALVVWEDDAAGTWDIQAKDLATGRTFAVFAGPGDQRQPVVSGSLVVWADNRAGTWDVYGAYITNDQAGTAFPIAGGPGDQTHPVVSGTTVAWQSTTGTRWDVLAQDISAGQPLTLSVASTTNINPAIDGNLVVWQSTVPTMTLKGPGVAGDWDIVGATIAGTGAFSVTNGGGQHTNPAINGNLVVWQQSTGDHWTISGKDLGTGSTFAVTNAPGDQTAPSISDEQVAYLGSEVGPAGAAPLDCGANGQRRAVRETHARSGGADDTPISAYGCSVQRPHTSHGRTVWDQDPPGVSAESDIYGNVCNTTYSDVHPADYFFDPVRSLACAGALSGYADGTFRPYNNTTRAQMVKIVVLGYGRPASTPANGAYTFADVPPAFPFFQVIETAAAGNIVNGYGCGSPNEPCDDQRRPYFRPNANVTRGQLSKIDVIAAGWPLLNPAARSFSDVQPGTAFYQFVETAACRQLISGYQCGGPGETCDDQRRPYFRQNNNATRGQIAKIVYLSVTNNSTCSGP
jgi:beta propeller repeat protein